MAKPLLLPLTLCLLFLFHGSLARRNEHLQQQNQCQLDQIQAREPDNRVQAEAGSIESWNPNNDDLQCAGVAVERLTVEPNGLHLPSYSNAPQLIYIVKGNGVLGAVLPGCPETYEESQQQGQTSQEQQGQTSQEQQEQRSREEQEQRSREQERPRSREEEGQRSREQERHGSREHQGHRSQDDHSRFRELDRHQKVRHFREGDIIAIPAGVAYWTYNNGDSPFVAVTLLDSNNQENQLDQNPRRFYLAGNPDDEFEPQQQGRRQQSHRGEQSRQEQSRQEQGRQEQKGEHGQRRGEQERSEGNNIFSGFETRLLAEALNIDTETARKLQNQNDNRKNIVRVKGRLDFVSPARSREEREREEESERERKRERKHSGRDRPNGLEETFCSTRLIENIGDPSRADIYTPQAGRINSLNSFNLPILSHLRLSAERGVLYNDAIYAPNWNLNSHTIVYVIRGRARTQIVDENGNTLLDNEVRQGQLFVIPQNHAALSQAGNEGFEYIAFKTNENAQLATLAGKLSLFRALPESVITNAFQVSREQARKLKYNRKEATLLSSRRSSRSSEDDERRDVA